MISELPSAIGTCIEIHLLSGAEQCFDLIRAAWAHKMASRQVRCEICKSLGEYPPKQGHARRLASPFLLKQVQVVWLLEASPSGGAARGDHCSMTAMTAVTCPLCIFLFPRTTARRCLLPDGSAQKMNTEVVLCSSNSESVK